MKNLKLQAARGKSGKTQAQIAMEAGIETISYQRYEYGSRIPNVRTAIRIADALGVADVRELFAAAPEEPLQMDDTTKDAEGQEGRRADGESDENDDPGVRQCGCKGVKRMAATYIEKAQAIIALVQDMKHYEWRKIAHAIDREFEEAANRAVLTQNAAEDAMIRIRQEG